MFIFYIYFMIVEQKIKIRITNRNITHFKNLGYDVVRNQIRAGYNFIFIIDKYYTDFEELL
jgi:hypothetical protein